MLNFNTDRYSLVTKTLISFAILFILSIIILNFLYKDIQVFSSNSFPLQGIYDNTNDWILAGTIGFSIAEDISQCTIGQKQNFPASDIAAVSYHSDGKFLHARLWLSSPFQDPDTISVYQFKPLQRSYSLFIDIDSAYDIGQTYQLIVEWDAINQGWNKIIGEAPPAQLLYAKSDRFNKEYNYTNFSKIGKSHIDLSLDLAHVTSPTEYNIVAFASDTFRTNSSITCSLVDLTDAIHIPPPDFEISSSPSSVSLRPGENSIIELKIKNINTKLNSKVLLSAKNIDGLNTTIIPNQVSVPPQGTATSLLHIATENNIIPRPYTVSLNADILFPTVFANYLIKQAFNNTPSAHITKNYDFTISVLQSLTFEQHMNSFLINWFNPITGAYATIVTIITGILGWKIWSKKRNN